MSGVFAILVSLLAFLVPLAIPLFAQRWRTFAVIIGIGVVFFWWLTLDIDSPGGSAIGPFLGGLMLVGFAAGVIAKFVMLLSRRG